jgi:hypothetical protein
LYGRVMLNCCVVLMSVLAKEHIAENRTKSY